MLEKPQKQRKQKHSKKGRYLAVTKQTPFATPLHGQVDKARQARKPRFFFLFVFVLLCFVVAVFTFFFFCQGTSNLHSAQDVRLMSGIQQLPVLVDERNPWYNNSEKYHRVWS